MAPPHHIARHQQGLVVGMDLAMVQPAVASVLVAAVEAVGIPEHTPVAVFVWCMVVGLDP